MRLAILVLVAAVSLKSFSDEQERARQVIIVAQQATDIRKAAPFLLESNITLKGAKTLEGRYRLLFEGEKLWREDIVIGQDFLIRIRKGDTIYVKSSSGPVEHILSPFMRVGDYPDRFPLYPDVEFKIKSRKKEQMLECLTFRLRDTADEYCFADSIFVGKKGRASYYDFRPALGFRYPHGWRHEEHGLEYESLVQRIVKAHIAPANFNVDDTFSPEPTPPCKARPVGTVYEPRPSYPGPAKAARIQGVVSIKAIIKPDGTLEDARVIAGHPMLADAALATVKTWRYEPTVCDGKPVPVATTINVHFSLSGSLFPPR